MQQGPVGGVFGRELQQMLQPNEQVLGHVQGRGNQMMIATDKRVIIIKKGLATGGLFGTNSTSYDYHQITSIDVRKGMLDGYVEVSAGGVAQVRRMGSGDQMTAPNTLQYFKANEKAVMALVDTVRGRIAAAHAAGAYHNAPPVIHVAPQSVPSTQPSIPEQIQQLAALRDQGILTAEEFESKKQDLLARM